jgi:hypothetical protein
LRGYKRRTHFVSSGRKASPKTDNIQTISSFSLQKIRELALKLPCPMHNCAQQLAKLPTYFLPCVYRSDLSPRTSSLQQVIDICIAINLILPAFITRVTMTNSMNHELYTHHFHRQ